MQRCQICGKEIKDRPGRVYHPSCIKKMFGVKYFPAVVLSLSEIPQPPGKMEKMVSIASLQPRTAMTLNRKKKQLEMTPNQQEGEFILKSQVQALKYLPENQHTCMIIAAHMGTAVLPHCLVPLTDNSTAYMMRKAGKAKGETAKQENFLQLLDKRDRYSGDLVEIGEKLRHISDIPGLDVQLFFEIVMLSFLLGNSDIHFESFAALFDEKGNARLSPAYDIVSSQLALPAVDDFATPMMGKTKNLKGMDFLAFSRNLGIPEKTYTRIFLRFFKGKRIIGRLIKDSPLGMEEKLKFSDILNERFKRLLG